MPNPAHEVLSLLTAWIKSSLGVLYRASPVEGLTVWGGLAVGWSKRAASSWPVPRAATTTYHLAV